MTTKVKSALMRAIHTFWETLAATCPVGLVITVPMIREADWKYIGLSILAWLGTAVLAAVFSFIKSMAVGMPEADTGHVTVMAYNNYDENGDPVTTNTVEGSAEGYDGQP